MVSKATKLLLVRHGETIDNHRQILQGQTQGALNDVGIGQLERLSLQLKGAGISVFLSSDLRRAVQSCEILARPYGLPVITTSLLRERDWGSFTGCYIPSLKDKEWPEDIESLDDMMHRAEAFLQLVRDNYAGCTVLAVGHGIINKAVQAVYHAVSMRDIEKMGNAEVRTLML